MSNTTDKVIEQVGGVLEKSYDDLAHPTAKSLGNTLSLLPRTVNLWLGKWEKWIINGEESLKLTAEAIRDKVSKIPSDKLCEPEPYVMVTAIQQLSYCYDSEALREMYANLLVSSMNVDTKYQVHPSFVDVIKQLCPDEAKLLKKISNGDDSFPLIDIKLKRSSKKVISKRRRKMQSMTHRFSVLVNCNLSDENLVADIRIYLLELVGIVISLSPCKKACRMN